MISKAATVKEYLNELSPDRKAALSQLRSLIRRIAPNEVEAMACGMPVFGDLCGFASQKHYMAFYLCDVDTVKHYQTKLGKVSCGKCCIRFKRLDDLNLSVVESILKDALKRRKQGIVAACR